jgi:uncharacterized membrane protein
MLRSRSGWSDEQVESIIGSLLRTGVLLAGAVVLAGAAVYLVRHGSEHADVRVFHGEPSNLTTVGGIWAQSLNGRGRGLIQLGLLLLIATPIARVAFSLIAFARQRDWLYVGVTAIVLGVLLYSLVGRAG